MKFTDLFIQKPVLSGVLSLLILILGMRAVFELPVRQYPEMQNAQITVTTAYFGASPDAIAGFITAPLEAAISQAQGIDYISSSSTSGVSVITVVLRLNHDANKALTEINTKISSVKSQLPREAQEPVLAIQVGESIASMYMGFYSETLPTNKITDYLTRIVQPKLQGVPGVQQADILGARQFALRAWLDPEKLAAVGLTAGDVYLALQSNNYLAAVGATKGQMITVNLATDTDLKSLEEFRNLVVKQKDDQFVRLKDVGNVSLGAENYDFDVAFDGNQSVFIGLKLSPDANLLTVIDSVRQLFPSIQAEMPAGMTAKIVYDATKFVDSSIDEVVSTIVEALVIVTIVIFLFLGSPRSVIIPVIAMPLSMIGAFIVMYALGYTINLLTLLALVLAIGLVVDDAIIVVENIDRHLKMGKSPLDAALIGARELAGPVIAISVVLIAVYVPIGFQGGLTGALFSEFAFTLAGAVGVSAVVALILSPMMCAKFLNINNTHNKLVNIIDHIFEKLSLFYAKFLHGALNNWRVVVTFGVIILALLTLMFKFSQSELAPQEDQGLVLGFMNGAPTATTDQMRLYSKQVVGIAQSIPEYDHLFQLTGIPTANQGILGVLLKPWDQRTRLASDIQTELQGKLSGVAGANIFAFSPSPLPSGSSGLPVQFIVSTTDSFDRLDKIVQDIMARAQKSGKFYVLDSNLKLDKPQTRILIDKDKVIAMGLTLNQVGASLGAGLGGGFANYFSMDGRSYRVIPQMQQQDRLNAEQLADYHIRTPSGEIVSGSTIATLKKEVIPQALNRFQQLNSATISGVFGGTQGEAVQVLQDAAKPILPAGYVMDYAGETRQYVRESGGFMATLLFALIIIYLTLAAQFESFVDPLIVIMSVPMAIFGAMIFIFEGAATLNIYTQVGLVTLVGLIAKHGILIVQFANELQAEGQTKFMAIGNAARIRLRPILMTTAAMALGVIPLLMASGAGAVSRNHMGLVIFTGISLGTLFTLFVVPAMYMFLGRNLNKN